MGPLRLPPAHLQRFRARPDQQIDRSHGATFARVPPSRSGDRHWLDRLSIHAQSQLVCSRSKLLDSRQTRKRRLMDLGAWLARGRPPFPFLREKNGGATSRSGPDNLGAWLARGRPPFPFLREKNGGATSRSGP